jgi:hypothetical protein
MWMCMNMFVGSTCITWFGSCMQVHHSLQCNLFSFAINQSLAMFYLPQQSQQLACYAFHLTVGCSLYVYGSENQNQCKLLSECICQSV